ncbi:MAG: rod shape-determining protein [Lachnospiraceae bacterium]|nr:rod shape-determining protein [Lachnospiraceae bacterium]
MSQTDAAEKPVYGLDIGTRSIVGTVGYKTAERAFTVVAQCTKLHTTRAMMDGQIHDIAAVASTISEITKELEEQTGYKLKEVCIAAAGRVLNTASAFAEVEFEEEVVVDEEIVHTLEMMGVEKAHKKMKEETKGDGHHYICVAYTVIHYYLNGFVISSLEEHKASKIGVEVLVTFLPDEVIDGLYAAVGKAGLTVENLTLEPIAAMLVAIPENFRLLNIALVDVGAGTSDICITRDGSVVGYGMIPMAGDKLTEAIAKKRLVDYNSAERMKLEASGKKKTVTYTDIMGLKQKVDRQELLADIKDQVDEMACAIAKQITELNGDKPVSAVFVVGGGGKIPGFVEKLSEALNVPKERVALRGEEVLSFVTFLQEGIKKDSLLVTPIGICLNYYEQRNNFIFVRVNDERIKIYDNGALTVADAAMQYGYPNEKLFPARGKELTFTVNGEKRTVKGRLGDAAEITLNGEPAGINATIEQNARIKIVEGTRGADASCTVAKLPESKVALSFTVNGTKVACPRMIQANGENVSGLYEIKEGDVIISLDYYTLDQVLAFVDVVPTGNVYVNGASAEPATKVYDGAVIRVETEEVPATKKEETVEKPAEAVTMSQKIEEDVYESYVMSYDDYVREVPVEYKKPKQEEESKASRLMAILSSLNASESSLKFGKSMSTESYAPVRTGKPLPPLVPRNKEAAQNAGASEGTAVAENTAGDVTGAGMTANGQMTEPAVQRGTGAASVTSSMSETTTSGAASTGKGAADIVVIVNGQAKVLKGKSSYLLVDVLDVVAFNLADARGRQPVVKVNGVSTTFMQAIKDSDVIELGWKS